MKKSNNRGSSLILAIVLFAVLLTVGGAALTIINTNYRVRVKEGRRLQNLYESDAGLDVAYNILIGNFEAGIQMGSNKVNEIDPTELEELETTKEKADKINEVFKDGFKEVVTLEEIKACIEGSKYVVVDEDSTKTYKPVEMNSSNDGYPKLTCEEPQFENDLYTVTLQSEFESDESTSSTGKNIRKIEVVYELKVPDYESAVEVDMNTKIDDIEQLKSKIIGIDGNLSISGDINADIEGDIFVKGIKDDGIEDISSIYEKYRGGIILKNDNNKNTELTITGNVMTPKTFNIGNKSGNIDTTINGNLYAGNLYVGSKDGAYSQNNTTTINGEVVVDNDLAMKGNDTKLEIKDFYGINDKTYMVSSGNFESEKRVSSSIIVNGGTGTIDIRDNAYIMGTAYIDAKNHQGESYKTGESLAVKGNYIAYTKKQDSIDGYDFENYDFDLYGPLQLIDSKDGTELDIDQKSMYFQEFVNSPNGDGSISDGGVSLPENTKSVGAILYKDDTGIKAEQGTYTLNSNSPIYNKRKDYTKNVYCMGVLDDEDDYESIYNQLGGNQVTVGDDILNFANASEKAKTDFVLNPDANKTIYITDDIDLIRTKIDNSSKVEDDVVINENAIYIDASNTKNMVVLTNGNVEISVENNLQFNGTIVSTKNVDIAGTGNIEMKYDEKVVNRIISKYQSDLEGVIRAISNSSHSNTQNTVPVYSHQYDIKRYIQSRDWKILK